MILPVFIIARGVKRRLYIYWGDQGRSFDLPEWFTGGWDDRHSPTLTNNVPCSVQNPQHQQAKTTRRYRGSERVKGTLT